jgi:predicted DNA-binding protein (MmcQ/YjbR family)
MAKSSGAPGVRLGPKSVGRSLRGVTADELRSTCLGLDSAVEERPFRDPDVTVFKAGGKIFAITRLDGSPLRVSLKCDPDLAEQLRLTYPAITPGYHLNKRHWNTIALDGSLPEQMVRDMIEDSYALVARPRQA